MQRRSFLGSLAALLGGSMLPGRKAKLAVEEPIEVGWGNAYRLPFDYDAYRDRIWSDPTRIIYYSRAFDPDADGTQWK